MRDLKGSKLKRMTLGYSQVTCAGRTVACPLLFVRMAHATKVRTVEHLYESPVT